MDKLPRGAPFPWCGEVGSNHPDECGGGTRGQIKYRRRSGGHIRGRILGAISPELGWTWQSLTCCLSGAYTKTGSDCIPSGCRKMSRTKNREGVAGGAWSIQSRTLAPQPYTDCWLETGQMRSIEDQVREKASMPRLYQYFFVVSSHHRVAKVKTPNEWTLCKTASERICSASSFLRCILSRLRPTRLPKRNIRSPCYAKLMFRLYGLT